MAKHTKVGSGSINFNKKSVSSTSRSAFGKVTSGKKITITPKKPNFK